MSKYNNKICQYTQKKVTTLEKKEIQSQAKKFELEQLNIILTVGTTANFQKTVSKLKNKLGNKAIQINNRC